MCIIAISIGINPLFPVIICSNRDEFLSRPTSKLDFWQDYPILAARDLVNKGLQIGINKNTFDFASVLNFQVLQSNQNQFQSVSSFKQQNEQKAKEEEKTQTSQQTQEQSQTSEQQVFLTRGDLPLLYLTTPDKKEFLQSIEKNKSQFKTFNLLFGNIPKREIYYFNNVKAQSIQQLQEGIHVVSNEDINCQ